MSVSSRTIERRGSSSIQANLHKHRIEMGKELLKCTIITIIAEAYGKWTLPLPAPFYIETAFSNKNIKLFTKLRMKESEQE